MPSPGEQQATVACFSPSLSLSVWATEALPSHAFMMLSDQLVTPSTNACVQQWG